MKELKMNYYVIHTPQGYYKQNGIFSKFIPHLEEATRFLDVEDIKFIPFNVSDNWIRNIKITEELVYKKGN